MGSLTRVVLFLFGVYFLQTLAADQYTDENRPYEFGFTIEGEQHRHEKKDENGIIMGEFGFITADGVYHVTVYATDENGNFKILSMKNIRVKPYPTSPGAGVKKSKSSTITTPQKDSVPESTNEEKVVKKQVASPAKSCSHCSLPTTTTTTTVPPATSKVSAKYTNSPSTEHYNHNQNKKNFINQNPISLQNAGDQQKDYNAKTQQFNPQTVEVNYPQKEQHDKTSQNGNLLKSQKVGYDEPNIEVRIQESYPQTNINNESDLLEVVDPKDPVQVINPENGQYVNSLNKSQNKSQNQQFLEPGVRLDNPNVYDVDRADLQPNHDPISRSLEASISEGFVPNQGLPQNNQSDNGPQNYQQNNLNSNNNDYFEGHDPISRSLEAPISERYVPNQGLPQNNQSDNGPQNYQQNNLNSNNNDYSEGQTYPQQQNYEQGSNVQKPNQSTVSIPPTVTSRQALLPHNEGEKSVSGNPKGERTPKSFGDFLQQSIGPEELANTGPNLYRPSIPSASDLSDKPVLLAAQIQKVDKNTNIYNKNPGESDGLPEGITTDDINNLLYTFNYTVGFHGHHEKGYSNGAKQGYYYVTGRNGVRTRVDYVADEEGFRPKITQEILDIVSDEVPKPETEKDEKYGLKGYEFKWLYFPLDSKSI